GGGGGEGGGGGGEGGGWGWGEEEGGEGAPLSSHYCSGLGQRLRSHRHGIARARRAVRSRARQRDKQGPNAHESPGFGVSLNAQAGRFRIGGSGGMTSAALMASPPHLNFAHVLVQAPGRCMMGKTFSAEVHMPTLPIKAFAVLALGLVTIAPSFALEDNQCYRSCKARCVARYACEGRHPGPNCFTNFNKCRTSCWRMCRHLTGFLPKAS